jgi:hypothetical protein
MDKVENPRNPECYIPWSEPFRIYLTFLIFHVSQQISPKSVERADVPQPSKYDNGIKDDPQNGNRSYNAVDTSTRSLSLVCRRTSAADVVGKIMIGNQL